MKLWCVFEKGERLRFIGHLDLLRAIQRAIRRSGIPAAYSQGFNPHIVINFAAPLSLGMPGLREVVEIKLDEKTVVFNEAAMCTALKKAFPEALRVVGTRLLPDTHASPMALLTAAWYHIDLTGREDLLAAMPGFMAQAEIPAVRRTKTGDKPCDIKPMIHAFSMDEHSLDATLALCEAQTCKPALLMEALSGFAKANVPDPMITRVRLLGVGSEGALCPLETL